MLHQDLALDRGCVLRDDISQLRTGEQGRKCAFSHFQLDHHDGRTDGPTVQRTDKAFYRVACPQLKRKENLNARLSYVKFVSNIFKYIAQSYSLRTDHLQKLHPKIQKDRQRRAKVTIYRVLIQHSLTLKLTPFYRSQKQRNST